MKKILKYIYRILFNTIPLQKLYEKCYPKFLRLMNYGTGADFNESGEKKVLGYVYKKMPEAKEIIVFDAGANIGAYSMEVSKIFKHRKIKVFSFEPSQETFKNLTQNLEGILNVIPVNYGLSDKEATINLFSDSSSSGLASVYNRRLDHFNKKLDKTEKIELTTIDAFCINNKIENIDFLKIDVEGHELNVLHGASRMINNGKIRFIQFEFGGCNIDSRTFFQDFYYLLNDKYRISRIVQNGFIPITGYKETQEIFLTINYFAELR